MDLLKNPLTVNFHGWQVFMRRMSSRRFHEKMRIVFARDNYTCQYCGFTARRFQQVVNRDHNYSNNRMSNLVTCCSLCSNVHFLGTQQGGRIIYLPEFSQAEIINLVRVLFCLIEAKTEHVDTAKALYRSMQHRSQVIEECFGKQMSDPTTFAYCYVDINQVLLQRKESLLKNLRLLPSRNSLEKPIMYWSTIVLPEFDKEMLTHVR